MPSRHVILKDGDLLKVDMVLSEPLDKSVLDVSKLDFDNVAQVKKYTESYTGGLADSCWAYAWLEMFLKKLKIWWTWLKNVFTKELRKQS